MSNKRVRMVIEFAIDEKALQEHGLEVEDVLQNIHVQQDDVCDGLDITAHIPGCDTTADFFIVGGDCVSIELIDDMSMGRAVLEEDGCTFVLKGVSLPNHEVEDINEAIKQGHVEDFACRIALASPPSAFAEKFARDRDGMYFEPDCFFIEATVGRDGADQNWERSNWFLFYTDVDGKDVYISDGYELPEAWDYVRDEFKELFDNMRKSSLDLVISAASQSVENPNNERKEHIEIER